MSASLSSVIAREENDRLYKQYARASLSLKYARQHDMDVLKEEAVIVGFTRRGVQGNYNGINQINEIALRCDNDPRGILSVRHTDDEYRWWSLNDKADVEQEWTPLRTDHIKALELSPAQIHFLEWSRDWENKIIAYWEGNTPFTSINEVIEDLKQNHDTTFADPPIKSATKME